MDSIIIGSSALHKWNPKEFSKPKDLDIVGVKDLDYHKLPKEIFRILSNYSSNGYLIPEGCYLLKVSHSFFDVQWSKTTSDIIKLQQVYGFNETRDKDFQPLYDFWCNYHENKKDRISLCKSNEDFFKDNVKRLYEHDDLHKMMTYDPLRVPWFYKLKNDKSLAFIPHTNFLRLTKEEKFQVVREEVFVTALERFLLTQRENDALLAYRAAIKKLVLTMSRGWFPRFIIENLNELKSPDIDYVSKFKERKNDYELTTKTE